MSGKFESDSDGAALVGCIGAICLLIIGAFMKGVALLYLWNWFVVPLGVQPLTSVWWAFGIALIVSFVSPTTTSSSSNDEDSDTTSVWLKLLVSTIIGPLSVLAIGYVVHSLAF